jgi:hypothetical protein
LTAVCCSAFPFHLNLYIGTYDTLNCCLHCDSNINYLQFVVFIILHYVFFHILEVRPIRMIWWICLYISYNYYLFFFLFIILTLYFSFIFIINYNYGIPQRLIIICLVLSFVFVRVSFLMNDICIINVIRYVLHYDDQSLLGIRYRSIIICLFILLFVRIRKWLIIICFLLLFKLLFVRTCLSFHAIRYVFRYDD